MMVNVKLPPYNATGDGVTSDTAAVLNAIRAVVAAGGGEVYFPKGTYALVNWIPEDIDAPVRFVGDGPGDVTLVGRGQREVGNQFIFIKAPLTVEGIRFTQFGYVLDGVESGVLDGDVVVRNCVFTQSGIALSWGVSAVPPVPREEVRGLYISECQFIGLIRGVVSGEMKAQVIQFDDNRILDCKLYGVRLETKGNLTPAEAFAERAFVAVRNNYVQNLNGEGTGLVDAKDVARVVQVVAERLIVTGNDVRDVRGGPTGGNANFVYQASRYAYVAGNYLQDVGTPGDRTGGIVQEKSAETTGGRYIDNVIVQTPRAGEPLSQPVFYIAGAGNVEVRGNDARGLGNSLVAAGFNPRNVVIAQNIVRSTQTFSAAILLYGGENVVIDSNVIDGVRNALSSPVTNFPRGIRVERYWTQAEAFAPTNVRISNNVVNDVQKVTGTTGPEGAGIYVYMNDVALKTVSIVDNTITYCDRGVSIVAAGDDGSVAELDVSDNTLRNNDTAVAVSPATTPFTATRNVGYPTENYGTVVVPAGTAVIVPHGLVRPPALAGITVTPNGNIGPATRFWVDPVVTATSFTVRFDVAPPAGTTFSWTAGIL